MEVVNPFEGLDAEKLQLLKYAVLLALAATEEQRLAYGLAQVPAELLTRERLCWRTWFEIKEALIKAHQRNDESGS